MRSLADVRRFAVGGLFKPAGLEQTLEMLAFVQADPIRAPARAQDLTLRPRVVGYRSGDLERLYSTLPVEEDVFINYGFVTRALQALMHPRNGGGLPPTARNARARAVLAFVRERGVVHPREVDARFAHGVVRNYWGGSSNSTTFLLEAMHYKGLLRVARREAGVRIYAIQQHGPPPQGASLRRARLDALVDIAVRKYAPLPSVSLTFVLRRLRYAVPQWSREIAGAVERARRRLSRARVDGETWYWPSEAPALLDPPLDAVRLLAPFDPVVWDRQRFELLWGWAYRFEAYTPPAKRKFGYYALPLLWRDRVVGWANLAIRAGQLQAEFGYVGGTKPRERAFARELEEELERMRLFLEPRILAASRPSLIVGPTDD
ncbi:MAG: crosslink repair DNA glycosylase YcaQ family protein [Vicinamibacterales bacterium]